MDYRKGIIFIIKNNDGLFLLAHKTGHPKTTWYFCAGGSEKNESIDETFFREVYEELGLNQNDFISYHSTGIKIKYDWPEDLVKTSNYLGQENEMIIAILKPDSLTDITITNELDEIKWVFWDELFEFIPYDNIKDILRKHKDVFND